MLTPVLCHVGHPYWASRSDRSREQLRAAGRMEPLRPRPSTLFTRRATPWPVQSPLSIITVAAPFKRTTTASLIISPYLLRRRVGISHGLCTLPGVYYEYLQSSTTAPPIPRCCKSRESKSSNATAIILLMSPAGSTSREVRIIPSAATAVDEPPAPLNSPLT